MLAIQLLRHGFYREPVGVGIKYFPDDLRLPFIDAKLRAHNKAPAVVIAPRGIFDRNAPIPENVTAVMLGFQDATFQTASCFCGKLTDEKRVHNPVCR
jgi:hypothetical protein